MFLQEHDHTIADLQADRETRERLFRVAAHDLKNPIANLRMVEYMLRDSFTTDPIAGQLVDTMQLSLDAMEQVVADFLDVVIIQSGKIDLHLKPIELGKIIYNQVLQYTMNATRKEITLKLGELKGAVMADQARLDQVVSNLLSNALKYSPRHTTVSLWVEQVGDKLRLNISDQGPGIPQEERSMLFTEFGKLTPRPTGEETSTGLGLWIVKQLAEMMDGQVGVDCPHDGGSIFWVELPAC